MSGDSDAFEVCDNGVWIRMYCAPGTWFKESHQQCTSKYADINIHLFMAHCVDIIKNSDAVTSTSIPYFDILAA